MNKTMRIKLIIDIIMTVLMLLAMAYQLTGNMAHEVIGAIIFILFVVHNFLNQPWYRSMLKGRYNVRRIISTSVNFLLLISMLHLMITGIMISRDIFSFLGINGGFTTRAVHTASANWGLVFMSVHVGMHWSMLMNVVGKVAGVITQSRIIAIATRTAAIIIVAYGVKSSFDLDIGSKLIMDFSFGYWDFENSAGGFFLAYLSVMGIYIFIIYYMLKIIEKYRKKIY